MSESDDIEQLELLLAAEAETLDDERKNCKTKKAEFLEGVPRACETVVNERIPDTSKSESLIHNGDTDSSDDEDRRNLEKKYDTYGEDIKRIIDAKEQHKRDAIFEFENNLNNTNNHNLSQEVQLDFQSRLREANSAKSSCSNNVNSIPKLTVKGKQFEKTDVYTDPVFGLRIVKPLISNSALLDRMEDRQPIRLWNVKKHVQYGDLSCDWVMAGVIVRKSDTKESQKGSQFSIWTLSDLKDDLKTVSLFLFKNAHKTFWKTTQGTVVGVLNPGVLDKRNDSKDEATLSVDNADKIMVIGQSKDLGFCKSRKKNGDICNAFVNVQQGEACIYHIKQEYTKFAKRSELQSPTMGRGIVNLQKKVFGKDTYMYGGKSFSAIPASKNKVLEKDKNRLMSLESYFKKTENDHLLVNKAPIGNNPLKTNYSKAGADRRSKDLERLEMLGNLSPLNTMKEKSVPSNVLKQTKLNSKLLPGCTGTPKLGIGLTKDSTIDFDLSFSKKQADKAKENALKWIQKNGPLKKNNPHNLKGTEEGKKRAFNNLLESVENASKKVKVGSSEESESSLSLKSERFKKMLGATSAHADLVKDYEESEKDKYFDKLEKKEAMEQKMLNTYKVPCKAVRCLRCKYTSFSASDKCKEEKHPLRVFDSFKRFFKCLDCGNRTVSLELIPLQSCKNCRSSRWERTGMMREKTAKIAESLSIRGEEEKFLGNLSTGGNINLLVPDE